MRNVNARAEAQAVASVSAARMLSSVDAAGRRGAARCPSLPHGAPCTAPAALQLQCEASGKQYRDAGGLEGRRLARAALHSTARRASFPKSQVLIIFSD